MEIPVYIITGFLESGKTTFIKNTLEDPNFASGEKTILLLCEEGFDSIYNTHITSSSWGQERHADRRLQS